MNLVSFGNFLRLVTYFPSLKDPPDRTFSSFLPDELFQKKLLHSIDLALGYLIKYFVEFSIWTLGCLGMIETWNCMQDLDTILEVEGLSPEMLHYRSKPFAGPNPLLDHSMTFLC